MYYGPNAEALFLLSQMQVDYMENQANPNAKLPYVKKMVALVDSLHACCDNEEIDKKNRKDCDVHTSAADSIKVKYWREFYNAGIAQVNEMVDMNQEKAQTTDSTQIAFYDEKIQAKFDTCVANMEIAMAIDPAQNRSYIGLGSAYQEAGQTEKAVEWKTKGLEAATSSTDSSALEFSIGYDYIKIGQYCEAVPFLEPYINSELAKLNNDPSAAIDTVTMFNLTICYNNCGQYEDALNTYHKMLTLDPANLDALNGIGRYYNQMGQNAGNAMSEAGDDAAKVTEYKAERDRLLDSAKVYFGKVFDVDPSELVATEMFAVLSAIDLDFESAAKAFDELTKLQPTNPDHWVALGDCYLNLDQFDNSITAYEKAVELQPTKRDLWEQLEGLYKQVNNKEKAAEVAKKLKELQ